MTTNEESLSQHSLNGRCSPAHRPGSAPEQKNDHDSCRSTKLRPQSQFNDSYMSHSAPTTPLKNGFSQSYLPPTASLPRAQGTNYPPGVQVPPRLQNGALSSSSAHGGDYTQHVHYPNNSGIIVKPLTDDEKTLHHGNSSASGDKCKVHEMRYEIGHIDTVL